MIDSSNIKLNTFNEDRIKGIYFKLGFQINNMKNWMNKGRMIEFRNNKFNTLIDDNYSENLTKNVTKVLEDLFERDDFKKYFFDNMFELYAGK